MASNDLEVQDIYLYADADGDGGHLIVADTLDDTKAAIALLNSDTMKVKGGILLLGPGEL